MSSAVTQTSRRQLTPRHNFLERSLRTAVTHCHHERSSEANTLARYQDEEGRSRELVALPAHEGSLLVLDRDAATLCDRRLVAHLAADEPHENAGLVCRHYLEDTNGRWCRRVRPEDLQADPLACDDDDVQDGEHDAQCELSGQDNCITGPNGNAYRLQLLGSERATLQLRWCRRSANGSSWEQSSLREVIAALESYEPMRTLTERAVMRHDNDPSVTLTRLRSEFDRLCASPIVLNRGLREAVLDAIDRRGTSMSEIALRCGVVKRDRRGNLSGETSWLARRIGIMPEGGRTAVTPWIHSDVLGVIARKGLGISPREVELQ